VLSLRNVTLLLALAACGSDDEWTPSQTFRFGPWMQAPGTENTDLCVAATLHNSEPLYVNAVEMAAGPGLHHSNWMWVPDTGAFDFPEGTFSCAQGDGSHPFDQQIAAVFGGVLFAQSTQAYAETQQFPPGAVIKIPPHSRIVADIHLYNAGDDPISVPLSLKLDLIPEGAVITELAELTMQNFAIALPPMQRSSFVVECDLTEQWQRLYGMGQVDTPDPQFNVYYSLAHYHKLGTGLQFEALRDSDGSSDMIWSTAGVIGDHLGGLLAPRFDMTGHSKLRLTCDYDNTQTSTVRWGNATGEMCVALAYTDSTYKWTLGLDDTSENPGSPVSVNGTQVFTAPSCSVIAADNFH
jgi:hypothetical protein